ncbi:uncharacterized protein Z518_06266 [Rhinocladiella mackenziei CBS 650.93]|uniref:Uncharacterized protein n=1 Tax=Rhinocladiella mackenziei CBS 650.93 TaxID=1442369 RepID=A0A0D2II05_9EURO|nr:uncharacterized protein Z518_06266 [Rhinocladiella mackenziei CBS 650.93]KIX05394.1 hypothetical protein Z518_06266 [Rhinocladiella mackenziei CBS 650.93]
MPSPNHRSRGSFGHAATGAALRRGDLKISDPIPFDDSGGIYPNPNSVIPTRYPSGYRSNDATWPRKSTAAQDFHMRHTSDVAPHNDTRTSAGPSIIPSSMSSIPSKASLNQKKPGGLRAALKRMFSGKRQRSVPNQTRGYHYSDPGSLIPVVEQQGRTRLDSAPPLGSVTRGTALASHSTHREAEVVDQSIPPPPRRGRRNTLPSLVFSDRESGLVPAVHDWKTAETSPSKRWVKEDYVSDGQLKRRSRSADALNQLLRHSGVEPSPARDRAGEIAYWRHSATQNPVPVYSGQSISVDPVHVLGPVSSVDESEREVSVANQMQNFDFGLDGTIPDEISLEQRVNTLEIKLFDFEYAIAKLQGNNIPKPMLNSRPFDRGPIPGIFPDNNTNLTLTSGSSHNLGSFSSPATDHDLTFLSSPGESPPPSPEADTMFRAERASKATTVTIRPLTAKRQSPRQSREGSPSSIHISPDKFEALMDMIKEEQAARQKLAAQVAELQKEVETMRTPVYATIRETYPTPSPESTHNTPGTPRTKTLHRTQAFQLSNTHEVSRFSGTDPDSDNEEGFQEVYETPLEQRDTFESARESPRMVVI